jgi:hypothetical protein
VQTAVARSLDRVKLIGSWVAKAEELEARIEQAVNEIAHCERRPRLSAPGREVEGIWFSASPLHLLSRMFSSSKREPLAEWRPLVPADTSPRV